MHRCLLIASAFAAACFASSSRASTLVEQQDFTFNAGQLAGAPSIALPGFDPSLGTLQSADLTIAGMVTPGNYVLSPSVISFLLKPSLGFNFTPANGSSSPTLPLFLSLTNEQSNVTASPFKTGAPENFNTSLSLPTGFVTSAAPGGTVGIQISGGTVIAFPAGVEIDQLQDTTVVTGAYTLAYSYVATTVPEPSALALLALPVCIMAGLRRRAMRAPRF